MDDALVQDQPCLVFSIAHLITSIAEAFDVTWLAKTQTCHYHRFLILISDVDKIGAGIRVSLGSCAKLAMLCPRFHDDAKCQIKAPNAV
jgi:hypothetical protein